jgi:hypothetical protein
LSLAPAAWCKEQTKRQKYGAREHFFHFSPRHIPRLCVQETTPEVGATRFSCRWA